MHNEKILCPIATTEGAIVASTSRGAKAITRCGGVTTRVIKRRIQRVPYFGTDCMHQAHKLSHWLMSHFDELKAKAGEVSQHCKLQSLQPWFVGNAVTLYNCLLVQICDSFLFDVYYSFYSEISLTSQLSRA